MNERTVENPKVVSEAEWIAARKELLAKEKKLTRQRGDLAPGGEENFGGAFWREEPVGDLSLHVWAGLGAGMPELLANCGSPRQPGNPSGAAGHEVDDCFESTAR